MRYPKRLRGLALGVIALVAGPIVAVLITRPAAADHPAWPASLAPSAESFVPAADLHPHLNDGEWRIRVPLPPPTPKPTPTPAAVRKAAPALTIPPAWNGDVTSIIEAAAARWGVSGTWMVNIAHCESGLRPNAYNPRGPYYGLFQFLMSTFTHNGGTNIWDPADQANIAAKMLAHGQAHQWSCA